MIFIRSVLGLVVLLRLVCANSATQKDPWIAKYNKMNANYSRSAWTRLFREGRHSDCNPKTVLVRKAWESMRPAERIAYTNAVQCLQAQPAQTPPEIVPGARTRFDDFLALHINQTHTIHWTAIFLSWHRFYMWSYEKELRDTCGYKGAQPYWDWPRFGNDPESGPMFNGRPDSMGSNGIYVPHNATITAPLGPNPAGALPPGTGGGCVHSGPFTNLTVNLGPVAIGHPIGDGSGYAYNPRCLSRDVNKFWTTSLTTYRNVTELIQTTHDIDSFQETLQGFTGVHGGGHFTIGGDPGNDIYASPGDPIFYMHHAGIDRLWSIWQEIDPDHRTDVISGTFTLKNVPPSRNQTLNDTLNLGKINEYKEVQIGTLVSTTRDRFCYIYE